MAYYYPEGYFGPICDDGLGELELKSLQREAIVPEDELVVVRDDNLPADYITFLGEPVLKNRRCKVRPDGTFYDCEDDWINFQPAWDAWGRCLDPGGVCYPWRTASQDGFRLEEDFFIPQLGPDSCSAFDPDINIRPTSFYTSNGKLITYNRRERSTPPTYPVTSTLEAVVSPSTISASFNSSGDIVVTGTGTGIIGLDFEWDDNPNTYGTALNTLSYPSKGVQFTQSGENGDDSDEFEASPGTIVAVISGGTGYGGFSVKDNGQRLCFRDLDGDDCNATLRISYVQATATISNVGYWNELGNTLGVWVNPMICTLPLEEQEVTYIIPIEQTDTYAFQFGCDDTAQIFLNEETVPFMDIVGGIFSGGAYATPYTNTRTLTGGTNLKLTVRCINSAAGFVDGNNKPYGLAYDWSRNPGGWFIRICRGGACASGNDINWVPSSPWSTWGDLMNTFAVWPSNTDPLVGIAQLTTWNVTVPTTGTYTLMTAADNTAVFSLDGTTLLTQSGYTSGSETSTTLTLTSGNHTIGVSATNIQNSAGATPNWGSNPAGVAWTLAASSGNSDLDANFDSLGNIVTTGNGTADVTFEFEWDDNPNTYGKATDRVNWSGFPPGHPGLSFTQSNSSSGSDQSTVNLQVGKNYLHQVFGNTGDFVIENNGKKICYRDRDANDCNAYVRITNISQTGGGFIGTSLDLSTPGDGNIIWTTRDAIGYEYYVSP
jgi:hypothetical protein